LLLAVVGVPDVQDVSCAAVGDVHTAVDVPGVPAVARVFSVDAVPTVIFMYLLLQGFPTFGVVGVSAVVSVSAVASFPAVVNVPAILLVLLLSLLFLKYQKIKHI
jgi:hypothetical protein